MIELATTHPKGPPHAETLTLSSGQLVMKPGFRRLIGSAALVALADTPLLLPHSRLVSRSFLGQECAALVRLPARAGPLDNEEVED